MFTEQIESLYIDEFKDFARKSIDKASEIQFEEDEEFIKDVFSATSKIVGILDADDLVHDMLLLSALIHGICKYDITTNGKEEDIMHPFHVRAFTKEFESIIGREAFNNVMQLIEGQQGFFAPIPQVMPSITDPIHLWVLPISIALAKE